MKSKLALFLYIVGLSAITYWAYPVIKERYFDGGKDAEISSSQENKDALKNGSADSYSTAENGNKNEPGPKEGDVNFPESEQGNMFLEITPVDCDNECIYFEIEKERDYCKQVCGLSAPTDPQDNGCDALSGLERDYCWKDEAVRKTDFSICQKIEDSKIKEVCQNRITEDIIDNQQLKN